MPKSSNKRKLNSLRKKNRNRNHSKKENVNLDSLLYGEQKGNNIPERCRCDESKCVCGGQDHYIYLIPKSGYSNLLHLVLEKSEIKGKRKEKYDSFECDFNELSKYKFSYQK